MLKCKDSKNLINLHVSDGHKVYRSEVDDIRVLGDLTV